MKSSIRRSIAALAIAASTAMGSIAIPSSPAIAVTFEQQEVNQTEFLAVAAPRTSAGTSHYLVVMRQRSNARPCWGVSGSNPTIVDPLWLNFDFTGICGRSLDSNGYSLRAAGEDLGLQYSLRVVNRGGDLTLVAAPNRPGGQQIEIAKANGTTTGFAKLNLNPGWRFAERSFQGRGTGHIYIATDTPLAQLTTPGTGTPGTGTPGTGTPGTGTPGTGTPGTGTPGTGTPGTGTPGTGTPGTGTTFRDVAGDTYANEIQQAVNVGFISGFSEDNTFRPRSPLTREQLVSLVLESLDRVPNVNLTIPTQTSSRPYPDVDASRWSAAKIQFARANNIISGYEDGTFRPTQPVTRAEMIAVLSRAAQYGQNLQGRGTQLQSQQPRTFSDTSGHWAAQVISQMSGYCGVASPVNETGTAFNPNGQALRNYAAAATLRMYNCLSGQQPQTQPPQTQPPQGGTQQR
jgi:hypothetical protein